MLVPFVALNSRHPNTTQCAKGSDQKWHRLEAKEMRESTERALQAYVQPLNLVTLFKYLGRILAALDDD